MKLRNILTIYLVLASVWSLGQIRESEDLPVFDPVPYFSLNDSITGWSLSLDGQWLGWSKIIPPIGVSRNEEFYEAKHNQFGIDNIQNLFVYHVKFGSDTLICLVKTFKNGEYKYPARKRGWHNYVDAYYCILHYKDLKKALAFFEDKKDDEVYVLRIKTLDSKLLSDIKERDILEEVKSNVIIRPNYDRNLALTLQNNKRDSTIHFHICNLHELFNDVEGVRQPFSRRGRSVYGSVKLFDYLYFEVDKTAFFEIIKLEDALARKELELEKALPYDDSYDWETEDSTD